MKNMSEVDDDDYDIRIELTDELVLKLLGE